MPSGVGLELVLGLEVGGERGVGVLIIMIGTCEGGLGQVHGPYQRGSAGAQCDLTVIRCQNEMVALQPFKKSFNQSQLREIHACMHTLTLIKSDQYTHTRTHCTVKTKGCQCHALKVGSTLRNQLLEIYLSTQRALSMCIKLDGAKTWTAVK